MPEYVRQLKDEASEASQHFQNMAACIAVLAECEPEYLKDSHAIDVDYFDLKALPRFGAR